MTEIRQIQANHAQDSFHKQEIKGEILGRGKEENLIKVSKREKVGVSPSDNDTDPHGNDETRGQNVEDERTNDNDLPPDDDTELHRNDETKGNALEDKSGHEESPKTDKLLGNYSLSSLTEQEKEQILQLSKQETLEEGIAYALRHMMTKICKEAGEEVTPLELSLRSLHIDFTMQKNG